MAKDDKDIEGAEDGGGGKKKLIIIIAAVALLLIGGGLAAFFLIGGEDPADQNAQSGQEAEQQAEPIDEGEPLYVQMKPRLLVNLPPGSRPKMLQVGITLLTHQQEVSDFVSTNDPMLRHHLIELLEQQDGKALLTLEGKQALQTAIQELLTGKLEEHKTPGRIKGVYFTEFVLE